MRRLFIVWCVCAGLFSFLLFPEQKAFSQEEISKHKSLDERISEQTSREQQYILYNEFLSNKMNPMAGATPYEKTCLTSGGGRVHGCDGDSISFCAQLNAYVTLDLCTEVADRQMSKYLADQNKREETPQAIANRRAFFNTPQGRVVAGQSAFYARREISMCVIRNQTDVGVLDKCKVDYRQIYAIGAVDYVAKIRAAQPRGVGMTIGGRAAWATPWAKRYCRPLVGGYRCSWKGIVLEY